MRIDDASAQQHFKSTAGQQLERSRDLQDKTQELVRDHEDLQEELTEEQKSMLEEELQEMVQRINKVTGDMNISLQFELHEQSERWMVQVVDTLENEILKEIPPEKLLDLYGRIRDVIGMLIDERR